MYRSLGKRLLDVILALVAIILLSPVLVLIALAIKLLDPGPIIFKQIRIGRGGRSFVFYKFRSMPTSTKDLPSDKLGTIKIGVVGKVIRRTNLDELPQLINILKGDMSVVGPRPPIVSQAELIALRQESGALQCRPGLTGLAQVSSFDGMSVAQKAEFDAQYARAITLVHDAKIVMRTFLYVLKPPPVY